MTSSETITANDLKELAEDLKKEGAKPSKQMDQKPTYSTTDRARLQKVLLQQTIRLAFNEVPYYKELAKSHKISPSSIRDAKDLKRLPQLEGTIVREQPYRLVAKSKVGSIVTTHQSSGTTGRPVRIYVSRDELDALRYYNEIMSAYVGAHRYKISLVITAWNPTISNTLTDFAIVSKILPIRGRRFEKVIDDILYEHRLAGTKARVSVLYLDSTRYIRVLTEEMLVRGIDPSSTSIQDVWIMEVVSEPARKWIKAKWKARVHSLYSLTECMGGAVECEKHNYHFDIRVIPEIVDFQKPQPVEEGSEGKLLLTTLSPFQQAMPLLRYSTGDIVVRGTDGCSCGEKGLTMARVLGKAEHCVYLGDIVGKGCKKRWLGHTEVKNLLEGFPEYFIITGFGAPLIKFKYRIWHKHAKIKMVVGLNKKMASEKQHALRVVADEIYQAFPLWQKWLDSKEIDIQTELRSVSNITDPQTFGFFPQH